MLSAIRAVSIKPEEETLAMELASVPAAGPVQSPRVNVERRRHPAQQRSGLFLLNAEELPLWDALVENSRESSVFLKSWWLNAASGRAQVLGYFEGGRLVAGIPLHHERRAGIRVCIMPKLTQTMGVVIQTLPGKKVAQETRETEILERFAARLSEELVFIQAFHPEQLNWLPFHWRGYTQTTHYTYVLDNLSSLSDIWEGLEKDRRNNIRKARRLNLSVRECGPEVVYQAVNASFQRQNRSCPYSLDYLAKLYEAARANNGGICMAASDSQGRVHAAEFFAWDGKRGYRVAGGHDTALGSSGGAVLLVWTLIEFAATRTSIFDFEGSMHKPIEASFRSFGARRVPYNRIVKMPRWLRIALCTAALPFV
jgi:hypothetical protein